MWSGKLGLKLDLTLGVGLVRWFYGDTLVSTGYMGQDPSVERSWNARHGILPITLPVYFLAKVPTYLENLLLTGMFLVSANTP